MIFQGELLDKVITGEKTVTRRLCSDNRASPWWVVKCALRPGLVRKAQRGRGVTGEAWIKIRGVELHTLKPLIHGELVAAEDEARLEGFASVAQMSEAWRAINGAQAWDATLKVWRIEFEFAGLVEAAAA